MVNVLVGQYYIPYMNSMENKSRLSDLLGVYEPKRFVGPQVE